MSEILLLSYRFSLVSRAIIFSIPEFLLQGNALVYAQIRVYAQRPIKMHDEMQYRFLYTQKMTKSKTFFIGHGVSNIVHSTRYKKVG